MIPSPILGIAPLFVLIPHSVPHVAHLLPVPHVAHLLLVPHVAHLHLVPHAAPLLFAPHTAHLLVWPLATYLSLAFLWPVRILLTQGIVPSFFFKSLRPRQSLQSLFATPSFPSSISPHCQKSIKDEYFNIAMLSQHFRYESSEPGVQNSLPGH
ncbi:hypothetical protein Taro_026098 [Colocasia esculenta]|uniref:Uncharacterized protein n=1 Tax=Colocasia esculenta TaxID=4460 RepID=A0A843VJK5_COLES|nr:hypothetical protein [Colocasia esculenta]